MQQDRSKDNGAKKESWWRRNRNKIFAVVTATLTGGPLAGAIALAGALFINRVAFNYNPSITPKMEVIMDRWVDTYFNPWYVAIIQSVDGEITKVNTFRRSAGADNPVIEVVNEARQQIAIMKAWLKNSTENIPLGWNMDMLLERNQFANACISDVELAITNYLIEKGVTDSGQEVRIDASETTSYNGMVYDWKSAEYTTYRQIDPTSVNIDLSSDPIEIIMPDEDIIMPDLPPDPLDEEIIIQDPTKPKESKKLPLVVHVLGWLAVAFVGKKLISKKK